MISIKVNSKPCNNAITPMGMLNTQHGTVFRGFFNGQLTKDYFVSCGVGELSVVHIWYFDEDNKYLISTSDAKDLKGYTEAFKVVRIDAKISIDITT